MVGLEAQSRPQNPQQQNFRFNKGEEVEVSSDEDGFRGAWYRATIVEHLAKSSSKKRKKVTVEYKTLVTEDCTPLQETVEAGHVRPLPPQDLNGTDNVFQENDVVDAGYRDGWWTGIVRKVLEGSRYRVYFDNPPDVIDFDGKDLRTHWEWVNGNWVPSEKQQTAGSNFSSGTAVEVNIDKETVHDAWFPAVVVKENGDNTFLVKYQSSGNSDEAGTKVFVDSQHIRPIPPHYVDRNYELLEKVDAQYGIGWRVGLITKLLAGKRYNVFLKQVNEDKELSHSEIRPHMEWVDGQWICRSKGVLIPCDKKNQLRSADNSSGNPDMSIEPGSCCADEGKTEEKAPCSPPTSTKNLLDCNKKSSTPVMPPSKKVKRAAPDGTGDHLCPSKKSAEEDTVDVPISFASVPLMKTPIAPTAKETLRGLAFPRTARKRTGYSKKSMVGDQAAAQMESLLEGKEDVVSHADRILIRIKELPEKSKRKKVLDMDHQKLDTVTKKGRLTKSPFGSLKSLSGANAISHMNESKENNEEGIPLVIALEARGGQFSCEETLKFMRDQKKNLNDSAGVKTMGLNLYKRGSSQRRKRGRPRKLVLAKALEAGEENGIQDVELAVRDQTSNEVELPIQTGVECKVSQAASGEKVAEVSEVACLTEVDMPITTVSNDVADEDQPLSMWIGGMHSSASAEELRSTGRPSNGWNEKGGSDVELAVVASRSEATVESTPDGNQCLPFVKRSLIWKTIESMEVFQVTPQKPHFRPLADCKEEYREGSAIGIMVTFASLFEKITSLQFEDSKRILESTLESLLDLERHGFDVTMPRDRVNELLSIKDGKEELLNESRDVEKQIREHADERRKLDTNINDIQKKIIELQEELAVLKSMMEKKDLEIAKLQLHVDSVNGQLVDAQNSFSKVASAPWKLP